MIVLLQLDMEVSVRRLADIIGLRGRRACKLAVNITVFERDFVFLLVRLLRLGGESESRYGLDRHKTQPQR